MDTLKDKLEEMKYEMPEEILSSVLPELPVDSPHSTCRVKSIGCESF